MTFLTKKWHLDGRLGRRRYDPKDHLAPYRDKRPKRLDQDREADETLAWLTEDNPPGHLVEDD